MLGCALAGFVLSILLRQWGRQMARVDDGLRRRICVDDLAVWARGPPDDVSPAAAEGVAVTQAFEVAMDWRLCGRALSSRTRPLRGAGSSDRLLGTQDGYLGGIASIRRARRAPVAAALTPGVGPIQASQPASITYRWRCRLGAASGTTAWVYGAACGSPPARELEMLPRAARAAVCYGGLCASAEIAFAFSSPACRLSLLAPAIQAAKTRGRAALTSLHGGPRRAPWLRGTGGALALCWPRFATWLSRTWDRCGELARSGHGPPRMAACGPPRSRCSAHSDGGMASRPVAVGRGAQG
jgi:hypothetical protein